MANDCSNQGSNSGPADSTFTETHEPLSLMKERRRIQYPILSDFLCVFVSLLYLLLYSCSTNKYISGWSTIDPPSHTSSTSKWSTRCKFWELILFLYCFLLSNSYFLLHHLISSFPHLLSLYTANDGSLKHNLMHDWILSYWFELKLWITIAVDNPERQ
jgi:hypothetical protein